jgi:acyl CoA:acetate/3-ketoacid CoA transferase beta subunit
MSVANVDVIPASRHPDFPPVGVITDLAVTEVTPDGRILTETAPDVTIEQVLAAPAVDLSLAWPPLGSGWQACTLCR